MAKFEILSGKALANAIAGRAKAVETFTQREHQLAFSALHHVELHSDPKYLNALYAVTPANYRTGLRNWATALGKVSFNSESKEFEYSKGKKSDMEKAADIAPANFEKEKGKAREEAEFDEAAFLEKVVAKMTEKGASPRVLQAVKGALTLAKTPVSAPVEKAPAKVAKVAKPETAQPEQIAA